jgi:RNA polymerase sigma factor (sigma-70 family)
MKEWMMHQPDHSSLNEESDFTLLYRKHALTVLRYLNAHLKLKEDAEDLLIEVFLALFSNLAVQKQSDAEQRAWLLRVARNKLADHYRLGNQQRNTVPIEAFAEMLIDDDIHQLPEPSILRHEDHAHLQAHIETLNGLQQEVLRLRFAYGMHSGEIGKKLNKNAAAIRAILSRTLNQLRLSYKKQEIQD